VADTYDIIIRNALVVDGTGSPGRPADVGIRDDTIAAVGTVQGDAGHTLDATGLVLAPGFIDIHTHSDRTLVIDPGCDGALAQGVTTHVIGNCGSSPVPAIDDYAEEEDAFFARYDIKRTWSTMAEYLRAIDERGVGLNVVALAGHGAIRRAAMGGSHMRPPDARELTAMRRHIADSLDAGAIGMSTGLIYPPSSYADTEELVEISKEMGQADRIYATHMRDEGLGLLDSVNEAIEIGRRSGSRVQIAHHKASDPRAWGLVNESLALIDQANADGLEIDFDQYPYRATSNGLASLLPAWVHEGGNKAILARVRDRQQRARMVDEILSREGPRAGITWDDVLVADCRGDRTADGKTIAQLARERKMDPVDVLMDLLDKSDGIVAGIYFSLSEDDIVTVMQHPGMIVGSDSSARVIGGKTHEGKPHPRGYGTFPRILGEYVRDRGVLTLEDAVRKMTSRPAEKLRLDDRGTIDVGKRADIVLFNPATVRETATFQEPHAYPEGIPTVIVNGRLAFLNGERQDTLAGRVLRA
jgi:N-acyl-D-amino-acid deacylase